MNEIKNKIKGHIRKERIRNKNVLSKNMTHRYGEKKIMSKMYILRKIIIYNVELQLRISDVWFFRFRYVK